MKSEGSDQRLSIDEARLLFLGAQGLLDDPTRKATPSSVEKLIRSLGFVQIDSINYVERAHHLTLGARLDGYRPRMLHRLLEQKRSLFEHWTHDASAIPSQWFPHWRPRFEKFLERAKRSAWWRTRMGKNPAKVMRQVRERIESEGPLLSRDFEDNRKGLSKEQKAWWGWKPHKLALECLWRSGELAIAKRLNFQKVYDLTHRVLPHVHHLSRPEREEHLDWACTTALERLGVATPTELSCFWNAVSAAESRAWCARAEREGRIVQVEVEPARDGKTPSQRAYAPYDWRDRLARLVEPPDRIRLLCPFDPILRDRKRALHLFRFDYRFEAFVPEAKRIHGYYVMPILEGDRFVGRFDPKFDRPSSTLLIRNIWWEDGVRATRARRSSLDEAAERLAAAIGAAHIDHI